MIMDEKDEEEDDDDEDEEDQALKANSRGIYWYEMQATHFGCIHIFVLIWKFFFASAWPT